MDKLITPEPGLILWTLFTFGLLLVLLRLFAWKPLLAVIEEYSDLRRFTFRVIKYQIADLVQIVNEDLTHRSPIDMDPRSSGQHHSIHTVRMQQSQFGSDPRSQ